MIHKYSSQIGGFVCMYSLQGKVVPVDQRKLNITKKFTLDTALLISASKNTVLSKATFLIEQVKLAPK
jgi:hypothetical protein